MVSSSLAGECNVNVTTRGGVVTMRREETGDDPQSID